VGFSLDELKDTSKINLDALAKSIVSQCAEHQTGDQVQRVVQWTNIILNGQVMITK